MFCVQQLYWILWAVYPTPAVFEGLRSSPYFPAKDSNYFLRLFTNKQKRTHKNDLVGSVSFEKMYSFHILTRKVSDGVL